MNAASKVFLQAILETDSTLSEAERSTVRQFMEGAAPEALLKGPLLLTQKAAAELLGVSRVTLWRLTRRQVLNPLEISPGTFRYRYEDLVSWVSREQRCDVQ